MIGFETPTPAPGWETRRSEPTWGRDSMIAAAHPLIVTAGAEIQRQGGNAVDVAVACGLAASVVMPEMCGLGGDLFAVLHDPRTGKTEAVMGSGISPRAATDEIMLDAGDRAGRKMPNRGPLSIGVPGMVDAYRTLLERWGTMSFAQVAEPAIDFARNGFALLPLGAMYIANAAEMLRKDPAAAALFFRDGEPLKTGDRLVQSGLADTLEAIGRDGTETFYRGEIAKRMLAYLSDQGALLSEEDFAGHETDVAAPLAVTYRGYTVHQTCLPSQGLILLEELNIVEHGQIADPVDVEAIHLMVEAKKLAYADRLGHVADPKFHDNPLDQLLSKEWAKQRYALIDPEKAATDVPHGEMSKGDTTYLATADGDGMMVSLIQSVSSDFGSGVVAGDTGVVMNNRVGRGFSLVEGHPNYFAPGKKTMHTLNAYLIDDPQGRPVIAGGTPGGDGQPQWNLQAISALIDGGMDVQQAVDLPRWTSWPGTDPASIDNPFELRMEARYSEETRKALAEKGHEVKVQGAWSGGGSAQLIARDPETGVMAGGSDSRVEGLALGR